MFDATWVHAILYYIEALAIGFVGVFLFAKATRFDDLREIGKGNVAAALATGGQVLGLAIVMHAAISHGDSYLGVLAWGGLGFLLQVGGYLLFDLLTAWRTDHQIAHGNAAVGTLVATATVAIALLVAAAIS